jgi:hypothetical protein
MRHAVLAGAPPTAAVAQGGARPRWSSPRVGPCASPCRAGGATAWPLGVSVTALVPTPARTMGPARDGGRHRAQIPRQEEAVGSRVGAHTAPINSKLSFGSSRHGDRHDTPTPHAHPCHVGPTAWLLGASRRLGLALDLPAAGACRRH